MTRPTTTEATAATAATTTTPASRLAAPTETGLVMLCATPPATTRRACGTAVIAITALAGTTTVPTAPTGTTTVPTAPTGTTTVPTAPTVWTIRTATSLPMRPRTAAMWG